MVKGLAYEDEPFFADYYDLIPFFADRTDVEFYVQYSRAAGGRTLELGCGTGRVLIPTAADGCEIVGLDLSEYMLTRCRAKLADQSAEVQQRVELVQADMTDFDLNEKFDLITLPFKPFHHLISTQDQMACLECVRRHLAKGARLVLDLAHMYAKRMFDPVYLNEEEDVHEFELPDGRRMRRTNRVVEFHRAEQHNDVELIFYITHPDGRHERLVQGFPFRYFFRYEIEYLLALSGFRTAELFGDFDKYPMRDGSHEMIFVAEAADWP